MTTQEIKTKSYTTANRCLQNAMEILKTKAIKQGKFYEDQKYVRMACGAAYSGTLIALDAYLELKGKEIIKKKHQRKNVDDYTKALSEIDNKLLKEFQTVYSVLHLDGYYDGARKIEVIKSGMDSAAEIINKIRPKDV